MPSCAASNFNNNNSSSSNGDRNTAPTVLPRRKFSFPAVLHHSQGLYAELGGSGGFTGGGGGGGPSLAVATARRRFSNVSDAVSRKLSHTIGWRTAVPTEQIARQGRALCAQYLRWKLKRAGVYTRKCAGALRRARVSTSVAAAAPPAFDVGRGLFVPPRTDDADECSCVRREVFPTVLRIGQQLERLDPKLYTAGTAAAAAASCTTTATSAACRYRLLQQHRRHASRRDSTTAAVVLVSVSRELFRAGAQVTWAKVVSLMCVSAGLAVDSARRGRGEQLTDLIETFGEVVEDDLAAWIHYNGGWVSLYDSSCYFMIFHRGRHFNILFEWWCMLKSRQQHTYYMVEVLNQLF